MGRKAVLTEENNDLVVVAKTWIQAPKDSTPIEFEEVWDLDGSSHRGAAKQRLEVVFGDLHKYGLANNFELVEIFTDSEPGKRGPKSTTYLMSYNVFKHYISSSQTERGYRTRAKLHQAEEELERIKRNLSPAQALLQQVQMMVEIEQRQLEVESRVLRLESESGSGTGYNTIKGYCRLNDISAPQHLANKWGRTASKLARLQGVRIGKVPDERHGEVNSFPIAFLESHHETIFES
jgi:hypothetical protein